MDSTSRSTRSPIAIGVAVLVVLAFAVELRLKFGGVSMVRHIDDFGEALAAYVAAGSAALRARRSRTRARTSWLLMSAGTACWAVGQSIWTYYELFGGRQTPFPSPADLGFLLFPVLAAAGVLTRPAAAFAGKGRLRILLDGLLISSSLLLISWGTALGAVMRSDSAGVLAEVVSLAYPITDVIVLTVVVMVVSQARSGSRVGLVILATGLACLATGDSGFAYLSATGAYQTGSLVDVGWVAGFLLVAVAAYIDVDDHRIAPLDITPRAALLLPYLPAIAATVVALDAMRQRQNDTIFLLTTALAATALVLRQMVVLLDNRSLVARMSYQAFHDPLTGLANRALFSDRLAHALDLHRRDMRPVTVLQIDLDDFKAVNDALGHAVGDELLLRASERLRGAMRAGDTVARLGGDEFAILVEDAGDPLCVAESVLNSFDHPVQLGTREFRVRASVGVATLAPADGATTTTDFMQRVDMAMYAAKRAGKATAVLYTNDLDENAPNDFDRREALLAAVAAQDIEVAYQPCFTRDQYLVGYEALARWSHGGEPVSPAVFIPMAKALGCLPELDAIVLDKALAHAARNWPSNVAISVNTDLTTLCSPGLAARVSAALTRHDIDPSRLVVEILETDLVEGSDAAMAGVMGLRQLGARIAVDDFGVGYASLARLHALTPDIVKIDRSLVAAQPAGHSPELLDGIIDIAHRMGASVVAEGVETSAQLAAVRQAGCDGVQGYLWGRPQLGGLIPEQPWHRQIRGIDALPPVNLTA